jgi:transcriptional regulator with XRE-family HTH domain/quercetin dioxygenase-like cupin family protein
MAPVARSAEPGGDSLRSTTSADKEPGRGLRVNPSVVPPIGDRIRAERARRGVTVRGLAREVGVSASLISQIETGRSQPSVSTLYAITTALDISIEDIFAPGPAELSGAEPPSELAEDYEALAVAETAGHDAAVGVSGERYSGTEPPGVLPGQHSADGAPHAVAGAARPLRLDRDRRIGPVVHPDDREALTLDTGVIWELLGQVPGVHADFLLVTYQPGGASSSSGTLMRHSGIEYGYLISGELVLTLGFDEHHLHAGDAISFDSTTPHGYRNEGSEPAVGVWFVLERVH